MTLPLKKNLKKITRLKDAAFEGHIEEYEVRRLLEDVKPHSVQLWQSAGGRTTSVVLGLTQLQLKKVHAGTQRRIGEMRAEVKREMAEAQAHAESLERRVQKLSTKAEDQTEEIRRLRAELVAATERVSKAEEESAFAKEQLSVANFSIDRLSGRHKEDAESATDGSGALGSAAGRVHDYGLLHKNTQTLSVPMGGQPKVRRRVSASNPEDRPSRRAKLVPHVKPTAGSDAQVRQDAHFNRLWKDPEHRKNVKAMHEKAMATIQAQLRSGAGYEADKAVRHFLREYNNRWMTQGTSSFPSSFDVGEAFFATRRDFAGFCLLPERDYLVSFTDFLDFSTAADAPATAVEKAYALEDRVIYNVTSLDRADSLLLATDTTSSFGFVSANMVRRGDELSMLLVLGEQAPPENAQKLVDNVAAVRFNPNKQFLKTVDLSSNEPMYLPDTALLRTLALVRFNLKERRVESRQLMRELTNSFMVTSDSERMFPSRPGEPHAGAARAVEELDAVGSVWEVAKTLILLPSYLLARIEVTRTEGKRTQLGVEMNSSLKAKRAVEKANPESRVLLRRISAIRVVRQRPVTLEGRSYQAPVFQVPVEGYWRRFTDATQEGHDESGNPIVGRTWVRSHIRHKDKQAPLELKVVYIKASLSLARQRLARFRRKAASAVTGSRRSDAGGVSPPAPTATAAMELSGGDGTDALAQTEAGAFLYVMRCPAHGRDIFKVGFTDRDPEVRARELSGATASPTQFLVVQA
ncbi:unnamed protein product, partial [Brugia timori]|uniref:t-SNARE coiled-coil homology domain-containing protein n=1 Tax=Brugia timori TaxID=42155 RepID=A0A0R3Q563_9BILA